MLRYAFVLLILAMAASLLGVSGLLGNTAALARLLALTMTVLAALALAAGLLWRP